MGAIQVDRSFSILTPRRAEKRVEYHRDKKCKHSVDKKLGGEKKVRGTRKKRKMQ